MVISLLTKQKEKKCGWSTRDVKDLPKSFLAADKFTNCAKTINTVHDQSSCGSCWAVSTSAAASERYCIATGENTFLSGRDITSCCSDCGYGCNGGWPSSAWSYIKNQGIPTGSPDSTDKSLCVRYPFLTCMHHTDGEPQCSDYDFDTPKCQRSCDADTTYTKADYSADKRKSKTSYSVYGEENMMKDLYENGPMTVSYTVYQDFMTYSEGVYQHKTGSSLGGHAVVLEGWGETAEGVKYWVVKNNWNRFWGVNPKTGKHVDGDNGYFWIIRGKNDCGIESGAAAGTF
eukprot:UN00178